MAEGTWGPDINSPINSAKGNKQKKGPDFFR